MTHSRRVARALRAFERALHLGPAAFERLEKDLLAREQGIAGREKDLDRAASLVQRSSQEFARVKEALRTVLEAVCATAAADAICSRRRCG